MRWIFFLIATLSVPAFAQESWEYQWQYQGYYDQPTWRPYETERQQGYREMYQDYQRQQDQRTMRGWSYQQNIAPQEPLTRSPYDYGYDSNPTYR